MSIKLKDRNGNVRTYNNVSVIKLKDENDNDVLFTKSLHQKTIFMASENEFYSAQENGEGVATTIPVPPTKEHSIFKGWSKVSHEYNPANKEELPKVYLTNTELKAMWIDVPVGSALVEGLGSADNVVITVDSTVMAILTAINNGEYEEQDAYGNVFNKIPTFYRKVVLAEDNQITHASYSFTQHDNTWKPYPCFIKPDGVTVMPYILIGKYCMSSTSQANSVNATKVSMQIGAGRDLARALGTGYQLYDWQIQRLFQDLSMLFKGTVNVNQNPLLNTYHLDGGVWIDGICRDGTKWLCAYDTSKYVNNPTWTSDVNHTEGYSLVGYTATTSSNQTIKKLGYDANHPFFNYPNTLTGESGYSSYYYNGYFYANGNHPVLSLVSVSYAYYGLWYCYADDGWSYSSGVRLCYRPIA